MEDALGIQTDSGDSLNPIIASKNTIVGEGGTINPPTVRDTGHPLHAVQRSLSADEAKIWLDHERAVGARG